MSMCEKCWSDAHRGPQFSVAEEYTRLIQERDKSGHTCTPEEQAGEDAGWCWVCHRRTVHQYTQICINCGQDCWPKTEVSHE